MQTRVKKENDAVEQRIAEAVGDWDKNKPIQGTRRPKATLQILSSFEERFTQLQTERENMLQAKNVFDMIDTHSVGKVSKLDVAMEELNDLRGAWQTLIPIYDEINELREKPWIMVQPRKLRQTIDDLLASLKKLPSKFRAYESHHQTKQFLQNCSRVR